MKMLKPAARFIPSGYGAGGEPVLRFPVRGRMSLPKIVRLRLPSLTAFRVAVSFSPTRDYARGIALSRAGKTRHLADLHGVDPSGVDPSRRNFLIRCCQGASAALVPATLSRFGFSSNLTFDLSPAPVSEDTFHLQPRYRAQRELDALLLKTQAGLDDFITEEYQDQIAAILAEWSASLLQSPQDIRAIERALAPDFSGSSPLPLDSRLARSGPAVEVHQNKFDSHPTLGRDSFLRELRSSMNVFSEILIVEFQVTSVKANAAPSSGLPETHTTSSAESSI